MFALLLFCDIYKCDIGVLNGALCEFFRYGKVAKGRFTARISLCAHGSTGSDSGIVQDADGLFVAVLVVENVIHLRERKNAAICRGAVAYEKCSRGSAHVAKTCRTSV